MKKRSTNTFKDTLKKILHSKALWITGGILITVASAGFIGIAWFFGYFFNKTIEAPEGSREAFYAQKGPYTVSKEILEDASGNPSYIYYYPQTDQSNIPVILIGNGSNSNPTQYAELMEHFASHGYLVMDTYNEVTGTGEPIVDTLRKLDELVAEAESEAENADSAAGMSEDEGKSNILRQLDMEHIGLVGHSQGSTGVMNAHTNYEIGSRVTTGVSVSLPKLKWCDPEDVYDTSKIKVPWLIVTGTLDSYISSEASCVEALEKMPEDVEGYFLNATAQGHLAFENNGGKFRGAITGWFEYRLKGSEKAKTLFYGSQPELEENPGWTSVIY